MNIGKRFGIPSREKAYSIIPPIAVKLLKVGDRRIDTVNNLTRGIVQSAQYLNGFRWTYPLTGFKSLVDKFNFQNLNLTVDNHVIRQFGFRLCKVCGVVNGCIHLIDLKIGIAAGKLSVVNNFYKNLVFGGL